MRKLYVIFLFILIYSCSVDTANNTVELDPGLNKKLSLPIAAKIIPLETNKECAISFIRKTFIDLSKERVFVLSNFNIYIYNTRGEFLSKLRIGRGPGEINRIISFTVNEKTQTIYAIDEATKLCLFNYGGELKDVFDIKGFSSFDVSVLDDDNVFLLRNFVGGSEKHFIGVYNLSKREITKKFITESKSNYPQNTIATANNFSKYQGNTYFYCSNIFSLHKYEDNDFKELISFDIGDKSVPKSISDKFNKHHHCKLRKEAKAHDYIPFLLRSFYFKGYYFAVIDDDDLNCFAVDCSNNEPYYNGSLSSYFNLPNKKSMKLSCGIQENLIVFQCSPIDFFESDNSTADKEIQILGNKYKVNKFDNPMLVIIE